MRTLLARAYDEHLSNGFVSDETRACLRNAGITTVQLEQYIELRLPKENVQ